MCACVCVCGERIGGSIRVGGCLGVSGMVVVVLRSCPYEVLVAHEGTEFHGPGALLEGP